MYRCRRYVPSASRKAGTDMGKLSCPEHTDAHGQAVRGARVMRWPTSRVRGDLGPRARRAVPSGAHRRGLRRAPGQP
jgi:hypothetical protein